VPDFRIYGSKGFITFMVPNAAEFAELSELGFPLVKLAEPNTIKLPPWP
jgi:hypothetical protein